MRRCAQRLGASALAAVRAMAYEGAGTVEFLLDRDGRHHFMEMNTRLQVEHPVTEAITGIDLVEWQFRIAAGEPLPLAQERSPFRGPCDRGASLRRGPGARLHAGRAARSRVWQPPAGLRVEHALHSGVPILPFYDSMIAKVVAHGRDRDEARRRLVAGLDALVALGVPTNRRFLSRCIADPVFAAGDATTAFIGERARRAATTGPRTARIRWPRWLRWSLFQCASHHVDDRDGEPATHPLAHRLPVPMRLQRRRRRDGRERAAQRRAARRGRVGVRPGDVRSARAAPDLVAVRARWRRRNGGLCPRRRRCLAAASRCRAARRGPDARGAGAHARARRRRHTACVDERPGRRGDGARRRPGRVRSTARHAGGDEDGTCACRAARRRGPGRAGDERPAGRGRQRGRRARRCGVARGRRVVEASRWMRRHASSGGGATRSSGDQTGRAQ